MLSAPMSQADTGASPAESSKPDRPATGSWRQDLLLLAYAATLIAVLLPLSQLWPEPARARLDTPVERVTRAALLASMISQTLIAREHCVRPRWRVEAFLMSCLSGGDGLAQIFIVDVSAGKVASVKLLGPGSIQDLGTYAAADQSRWQQALRGDEPGFAQAPPSANETAAGLDRFIVPAGQAGKSVLVLRFRWRNPAVERPGQSVVTDQLLFRIDSHGVASTAPQQNDREVATPIADAPSVTLVLRSLNSRPDLPAPASGQPDGGLSADRRLWLTLGAVVLLALAGVALRVDRRWRAKERALADSLAKELQFNKDLVFELTGLRTELIEVAYASQQLGRWKEAISPLLAGLDELRRWLEAQPNSPEISRMRSTAGLARDAAEQISNVLKPVDTQPSLSVIGVRELIERSFKHVALDAERRGVSLFNAVNTRLPPVLVEPGMVVLALASLIDNSVQAMATLGGVPGANRSMIVKGWLLDDSSMIRLTIGDLGTGLSASQTERFGRMPDGSAGHSTGIALAGLSIARSNGRLELPGANRGGAELCVLLPVAATPLA